MTEWMNNISTVYTLLLCAIVDLCALNATVKFCQANRNIQLITV